uniref:STAS domain-containing protein n=1 Tax=Globodera rostochiensis TaxID=31243 RepID=A0A914HY04_GLORO
MLILRRCLCLHTDPDSSPTIANIRLEKFLFKIFNKCPKSRAHPTTMKRKRPRTNFGRCDLVTGVTIGIMVVPQAMAYTTLAGVPPAVGLYTCFFAAFFYLFLGTSIHVSIGTFAVASMMVGNTLAQLHLNGDNNGKLNLNGTNNATTSSFGADLANPLLVTSALTFGAGIFQLTMAVCRLSFLTVYISDPLVSGFTTAAAVHVLVAQMPKLIGVPSKPYGGPGMVIFMLRDLMSSVWHANLWTVGLSLCGIVFLGVGRDYLNPPFRKRFRVPLPLELIMVICSIGFSLLFKIEQNHGVKIIKHVPNGMPVPAMPRWDFLPLIWPNVLSIGLICYVFVISLEKIFAKRHRYAVEANQELYALGFSSLLSSFFPVYPFGASLSRSSLCEMLGAKSQLHALFSSTLLLAVILWLGPLLEPLPISILACIVVVSLKPLFLQYRDLPKLWAVSAYDMMIWMVAFFATVLLDITYGLVLAILFSIFTVVLREQWPALHQVGVAEADYQSDLSRIMPNANVEIWRFTSPLHFANAQKFIEQLRKTMKKIRENISQLPAANVAENELEISMEKTQKAVLVVDCAAVSHIDSVGVHALGEVFTDSKAHDIVLIFANFYDEHLTIFRRCELFEKIPEENFYSATLRATKGP